MIPENYQKRRDSIISNDNLYQLAMKTDLKNYLYVNEVKYEGKQANWLPPGYIVNEAYSERYLKQKTKRKAFC